MAESQLETISLKQIDNLLVDEKTFITFRDVKYKDLFSLAKKYLTQPLASNSFSETE